MATFDDDELERYYRRIEARTETARAGEVRRERSDAVPGREGPRRARSGRAGAADDCAEPCPTPDKEGYTDPDAAWLAIAVLRAGRLRTPDLDAYRCRCGVWHITSRGRE